MRVSSTAYVVSGHVHGERAQQKCRKLLQIKTPDSLATFAEMATAIVDSACLATLKACSISAIDQNLAQTGEQ
jgi:hypothetical protein